MDDIIFGGIVGALGVCLAMVSMKIIAKSVTGTTLVVPGPLTVSPYYKMFALAIGLLGLLGCVAIGQKLLATEASEQAFWMLAEVILAAFIIKFILPAFRNNVYLTQETLSIGSSEIKLSEITKIKYDDNFQEIVIYSTNQKIAVSRYCLGIKQFLKLLTEQAPDGVADSLTNLID